MKKTVLCFCLIAVLFCGGCVSRYDLKELRDERAEWVTENISFRYQGNLYRILPVDTMPENAVDEVDYDRKVAVADRNVPLMLLPNRGTWGNLTDNGAGAIFREEYYAREDMYDTLRDAAIRKVFKTYFLPSDQTPRPVTDEMREMLRETLSGDVRIQTEKEASRGEILRIRLSGDEYKEIAVILRDGKYYYKADLSLYGGEIYLMEIPEKYVPLIERICKG